MRVVATSVLALLVWSLAVDAFMAPTPRQASSTTYLFMTAEETSSKSDVKVGVIGMGRIGLVHLEAINKAPGVRPVIVSNPTVSKAEAGTTSVLVWNPIGSRRSLSKKTTIASCIEINLLIHPSCFSLSFSV